MLITLCAVSLFATTLDPVPGIEKEEERERLRLEETLLVEHRAGLEGITLVASRQKEDLEHRLEQERALKILVAPPQSAPSRYVRKGVLISEIVKGYEDIYRQFLRGKLIYKPDPKSDAGRIEIPFSSCVDPSTLEGTFDLSRCGDMGKYVSIATGCRLKKNLANDMKREIWLVPRFLVEHSHNSFKNIIDKWPQNCPVGIFWVWGSWDNLDWYDYLTNASIDDIISKDLYENWRQGRCVPTTARSAYTGRVVAPHAFHVSFVN
jgi:hypothetical protein